MDEEVTHDQVLEAVRQMFQESMDPECPCDAKEVLAYARFAIATLSDEHRACVVTDNVLNRALRRVMDGEIQGSGTKEHLEAADLLLRLLAPSASTARDIYERQRYICIHALSADGWYPEAIGRVLGMEEAHVQAVLGGSVVGDFEPDFKVQIPDGGSLAGRDGRGRPIILSTAIPVTEEETLAKYRSPRAVPIDDNET